MLSKRVHPGNRELFQGLKAIAWAEIRVPVTSLGWDKHPSSYTGPYLKGNFY